MSTSSACWTCSLPKGSESLTASYIQSCILGKKKQKKANLANTVTLQTEELSMLSKYTNQTT